MNQKIEIHNRSYDSGREAIKKWLIPDEEKKKFNTFLDDLSLGKVNKGKKISENRLCKYISCLKVPFEFWNKPISKLTIKDVEDFERGLISGKVKTSLGGEYAESTKSDIKKCLQIYVRWRIGEEKAIKLVGWLDTRVPKTTPDFLREEEIELLYKSCRNARERFLIAVLFDTGARAEEFFNIRYEDIFMPKDSTSFVKIALKEEYSKTKGRNISLYWKHSLEAVRDYLQERKEQGIRANEPIMTGDYNQARAFLRRLGEVKLKKRVHFHLFRHSSATYYAPKLGRQQLCIRYGWAFSSDMVDTYITRAGVGDKELDEKMQGTEIEKVKEDFFKKEQELKLKIEQIEKEQDEKFKLLAIGLREEFLQLEKERVRLWANAKRKGNTIILSGKKEDNFLNGINT